ncbi:MAG: acetate--CoA ligase family protein [Thaumarchaeota archaeon]|nr:acetate--CoA ligase family protein [Nitrososphaerota archaeon]
MGVTTEAEMRDSTTRGVEYFFEPSSIAVAGASDDLSKLASIIFSNLLRNHRAGVLKASLYPLNPAHRKVGGLRCYPTLKAVPEPPELLVVAVPATSALELVKEAAESGVKAVIMVSAGFAEVGKRELESEVLAIARRTGMRILGPNTMGLLDMTSGVDSTFLLPTKKLESGREVPSLLRPSKGGVVIITQSGHLSEIVSEELAAEGIGIRALVGTGNQLDVSVEDIIDYFADDDETKVIAVYLEGIRDGRRFVRLARRASARKPVVVFKLGKTTSGARAALTHTASLVGDYDAYRAAFKAAGVVEAGSLQELADLCVTFSLLSSKPGTRLVIVTNAGGVGAVAADEAERNGLVVSPMRSSLIHTIRRRFKESQFLSNVSLGNPLDLTATVPADDFSEATALALGSKDYDMALVLPTHQTPAIGPNIAARVSEAVSRTGKPACACVMGRAEFARMVHSDFIKHGMPSFPTPERTVRALTALSTYARLRASTKSPPPLGRRANVRFLRSATGPLAATQNGLLLSEYGIGQPPSVLVGTEAQLEKASKLGFPVACKLASRGMLHKAGAGAVILNVRDEGEMARSFSKLRKLAAKRDTPFEGMLVQKMVEGDVELLLGGKRDATFGPMVVFGAGGSNAELIQDVSVALAPLDLIEANNLVNDTRVGRKLTAGLHRTSSDPRGLLPLISRFSRMIAQNPSIAQVEINPLIVTSKAVLAVDARVVLDRQNE